MRRGIVIPTSECPCNGLYGPSWHRSRHRKLCEHAWELRQKQRNHPTPRQPKDVSHMQIKHRKLTVPAEECPCGGTRSWKWHRDREIPQCTYARALKYHNTNEWLDRVEHEREFVRHVLAQDPAAMPWNKGTPIYLDEEEVAA